MKTLLSGIAVAAVIAVAAPGWAQAPATPAAPGAPPAAAAPAPAPAATTPPAHRPVRHGAAAAAPHSRGGRGASDNVANQLNAQELGRLGAPAAAPEAPATGAMQPPMAAPMPPPMAGPMPGYGAPYAPPPWGYPPPMPYYPAPWGYPPPPGR
ncbi:MAG TPA: hypothetical protein VKQ73_17670 [Stellaceae bacterium]|nr:hypothetical protein [Stellaceae bacterium]